MGTASPTTIPSSQPTETPTEQAIDRSNGNGDDNGNEPNIQNGTNKVHASEENGVGITVIDIICLLMIICLIIGLWCFCSKSTKPNNNKNGRHIRLNNNDNEPIILNVDSIHDQIR